MKLDEVAGRRVAVWGVGVEGRAFARLLAERGSSPVLVDDDPAVAAADGAEVAAPGSGVLDRVDVVVRAPGVSRYRPELAAVEARGATVTTPMAVWLDDMAGRPVVAVTGTKGKSTTATLAAAILGHIGLTVALAGNIGVPVTDLYSDVDYDAYVIEVSSFQAAEVTVTPSVCVLTSLAPDHLDWHGDAEAYFRDKLRLIAAGPPGRLAVNASSREAVARTSWHPDRVLYGNSGVVSVTAGQVSVAGVPVIDAARLRVPGTHNVDNLCGAIAGAMLLRRLPPPAEAVAAAVDGFGGLPSRCASLGTVGDVEFVDDALASNPFASAASVTAFAGRPMTLIVGGADRGVDLTPLAEVLDDRDPPTAVIVIPPDPDRLARELAGADGPRRREVVVVPDLEAAVAAARSITSGGGVILFSPSAPTPPGEGGYAARSRRFAAAAGLGGD